MERCVEPQVEPGDLTRQRQVIAQQSKSRTGQRKRVPDFPPPTGGHELLQHFRRQSFLHPHHLLHEAAVYGKPRQQGEQPIPTDEVVEDLSPDQSEHARKEIAVRLHRALRHAHQAGEFPVDGFVDAAGEGKRQRCGDPAVALGDVGVVPERQLPVGIGQRAERGDGTRLQQPDFAPAQRPFDILRTPEEACGRPRECGHGLGVFVGQCRERPLGWWQRLGGQSLGGARRGEMDRGLAGDGAVQDPAVASDGERIRIALTRDER